MEKQREVEEKKKVIIQIIFLIVMLITIGSLIFSIITILRNSEQLTHPLEYNLGRFGLDSCSCFNKFGQIVRIDALNSTFNSSELIKPSAYRNYYDINYSLIIGALNNSR